MFKSKIWKSMHINFGMSWKMLKDIIRGRRDMDDEKESEPPNEVDDSEH